MFGHLASGMMRASSRWPSLSVSPSQVVALRL